MSYWIIVMVICYKSQLIGHCEIQHDKHLFMSKKDCEEYGHKTYYQFKECKEVEK